MQKNLSKISGKVISVSEPIFIERKEKNSFTKVTVGVSTKDQQTIFFELRETLPLMPEVNDNVIVSFYFAGSTKGEKVYNNIIATNFVICQM